MAWREGRRQKKVENDPQYSWDSDEDNFIDMGLELSWYGKCRIIGLHPHKDVLLLIDGKALAYHLNTSRMQFLGEKLVRTFYPFYVVKSAFTYRPCYVDMLPATKMSR